MVGMGGLETVCIPFPQCHSSQFNEGSHTGGGNYQLLVIVGCLIKTLHLIHIYHQTLQSSERFLFLMFSSNFSIEFLEMSHLTAQQCRRLYLIALSIGLILLLPSLGFT